MRKSVEHLGPQHEIVDLKMSPTLVLRVCPEFENRRIRFMEGILRQHGRLFPKAPFPYDRYPPASFTGRCYDQAAELSVSHGLTYCEGVLFMLSPSGMFGLPHGWCCTPEGVVVDPTLHKLQGGVQLSFVGIPLTRAFVSRWHRTYGYHGCLDGHPELGDSVGVYAEHPSVWRENLPIPGTSGSMFFHK